MKIERRQRVLFFSLFALYIDSRKIRQSFIKVPVTRVIDYKRSRIGERLKNFFFNIKNSDE